MAFLFLYFLLITVCTLMAEFSSATPIKDISWFFKVAILLFLFLLKSLRVICQLKLSSATKSPDESLLLVRGFLGVEPTSLEILFLLLTVLSKEGASPLSIGSQEKESVEAIIIILELLVFFFFGTKNLSIFIWFLALPQPFLLRASTRLKEFPDFLFLPFKVSTPA